MVSFAKKVAGFIFESEETTLQQSAPTNPISQTSQGTSGISPLNEVNQSLKERVLHEDSPYSRFLQQVKGLETAIPEEDKRYQVAIIASTPLGFGADSILKAIEEHLTELKNESRIFTDVMKENSDREIAEQKEQLGTIQQKIAALEVEMKGLVGQAQEKQRAIEEGEQKALRVRQEFAEAYNALEKQLIADKERLAKNRS